MFTLEYAKDPFYNNEELQVLLLQYSNKMKEYFQMDIKATRLNWYKDSTEFKPYHHDAAAVDPAKATVASAGKGLDTFGKLMSLNDF